MLYHQCVLLLFNIIISSGSVKLVLEIKLNTLLSQSSTLTTPYLQTIVQNKATSANSTHNLIIDAGSVSLTGKNHFI